MARSEDLKNELAKLVAGLSRPELQQSWRRLYGSDPPEQISRQLLTQAIAHRLQLKNLGVLSFPARRALERASEEVNSERGTKSGKQNIETGVILVRVWHGETHRATIVKEGVHYRGTRYRSLSEVARTITRTRWSGPRFFGLKTAKKNRAAR